MAGTSKIPESGAVRFVLDGELVELENVDPTRTVLQYLREDVRRTGTKEGCAEGDCGACTVVLAELDRTGDDISLRAINSCIQFLPTLDGKELITVESLASDSKNLHPIQKAMVENHGSQCGFCTPGFVMSLFALFKSKSDPTRREIDDALAGNLCRCTGYRPIIDAAKTMYADANHSDWLRQPFASQSVPADRINKLKSLQRDTALSLRSDEGEFFSPVSSTELTDTMAKHPNAILLAGGTDVGLWVTKQQRNLPTIIYTGNVKELCQIEINEDYIEIGAAVSLSDAVPVILEHFPQLEELFLRFASPPIRNAGTLGGNVANGSPIGDSMPALMAAATSLVLCSADGRREVSLDDFYKDYMVNDLRPGEFLELLRIPLPENDVVLRSYKISKRFDQDIAAVCGAFQLKLGRGKVESIRIAFGGMAATISRASNCEDALRGQEWNEVAIERAMAALENDFTPIDDMRASADYRIRVARNFLRRLYLETEGELPETVYSYGRGA